MNITRRAVLGAAGAAALAPAASAQTRWQMATPYADGNFHTRNIRGFVQDIEQAAGGRLSIQVHSNGALLRMPEIKRGVQTGQVQLGEILLTAYANEDPLFDADALPQLVTNFAQAKRLSDLQKPFIEARFARQGLSLLYMVPWPPAGLYAQQPVTSLEQLRGQRFRTFSPMTNRFAQLIGAQPTLVQAAELAQAFATGVVQAQITDDEERRLRLPPRAGRPAGRPAAGGPRGGRARRDARLRTGRAGDAGDGGDARRPRHAGGPALPAAARRPRPRRPHHGR